MRPSSNPLPLDGPVLTGIGAIIVGLSTFFTFVFGWRKSLKDRVDQTMEALWAENRALRIEMAGMATAMATLGRSNDLLQASNRELTARVETLLLTHSREIDHLKDFYQRQVDSLKGHVDTSIGLLQSSSSVPDLMNRDDIRDIQELLKKDGTD